MSCEWCVILFPPTKLTVELFSALGCQSLNFTNRSDLLPAHFLAEHSELNGVTLHLPSNTLRPSWQPFSPYISSPHELPKDIHLGSVLLMPTSSSFVHKKFQSCTSTSWPLSPRKLQRQILPKDRFQEKDEDELQIPEFGTLPQYNVSCHPQDLVIWRRPGVLDMDVSRPQNIHVGPVEDVPLSILYEVFAKKFDELENKQGAVL